MNDMMQMRDARIAELEEMCRDLEDKLDQQTKRVTELEAENEELRKVAEHQQATNIDRYFRNKALSAQFTRAQELVERLLCAYYTCHEPGAANSITIDAERFLKEAWK